MHRPLFPPNCHYTVVLVVLFKLESRKTPFYAPQVLRVARVRIRYLDAQDERRETVGNEEVDRRRCFLSANIEYGCVLTNKSTLLNYIQFESFFNHLQKKWLC